MDNRSPYAPPKSAVLTEHPGGWDGQYVRLRTPGAMPCHCITCGTDADLATRAAKLRYVNPLCYLAFFLSVPVLLIVYLIAVRRALVSYSQCPDCAAVLERWSTISKACAGVFLLSLAGCFAPIDEGLVVVLAWLAGVGMIGFLVAAALARPKMRVVKFSDGTFFIGGLKAAYRGRLSIWSAPGDLRNQREPRLTS